MPDAYTSAYTDRIYRLSFWRYFVSKIFNRPLPSDTPFPTPALFRQGRVFEGGLRLVPLAYLDAVSLPGDFTAAELAAVAARQQDYVGGRPTGTIDVHLRADGSMVIDRTFMPTVAAARALALDEIAVRVFYS
jgi:hypothetical protein